MRPMMRIHLAVLATVSLGVLAQPAAAQSVSRAGYKTALDTASCIVAAKGDEARALFATVPQSPEAASGIASLMKGGSCGTNAADPSIMRGALAERVYLKAYPTPPAEVSLTPAPFTGSGNPELATYDITRCAALRDPVGADMLVRSELRSDAEKAAVKRIIPVIGACTPAGSQIGFDREGMRGLIAEGLLTVRGAN
jgi:hypothetical protein